MAAELDSWEMMTIIEVEVRSLVQKIRNVDSLDGWTMRAMREVIENEVTRLRSNGVYLFRSHVLPDDVLYDNDISTNIKDWWKLRCELAHLPDLSDFNHEYFQRLSDVLQDMLRQVAARV